MKHLLFLFSILFSLSAYSQEPVKVNVTKPGTLSTLLTEAQKDTCQYLVVSGKLNSADIKVLRRMAGAKGHGRLKTLDLKDARIVSCEEPYLTIRDAEETIYPNISVELGSMNGVFAPRSADRWGEPLVQVYKANYIFPGTAQIKPDAQAITENMPRWKMLTKQKIHTKGHYVTRSKDEHYTYSAFTCKKMFCEDMFYGCPNLRIVIIPSKGKINEKVAVFDNPIRYMEVTKVLSFKK